jgi:hypothetical protein
MTIALALCSRFCTLLSKADHIVDGSKPKHAQKRDGRHEGSLGRDHEQHAEGVDDEEDKVADDERPTFPLLARHA